MAPNSDQITIDRTYFEALVQRANSTNGDCTTLPAMLANKDLMAIAQTEYDHLVFMASQFATLRYNLISGGIDENIIKLLSQDDASLQNREEANRHPVGLPASERVASDYIFSVNTHKPNVPGTLGDRANLALASLQNNYNAYSSGCGDNPYSGAVEWADVDHKVAVESMPEDNIPTFKKATSTGQEHPSSRAYFPRMCKRTIVLAGIPEGTTHEEISKVIRGGLLLEIYVKVSEQSALVSFLHEVDAFRFYEHSRKNDLYINHKRIFITFADRHFHLSGHVAGMIAQGATRNMVLRRCNPELTENSIRDDLEHIHNLVVVKIEFVGGSCYIKTNSVHNAMFARTCMMSRAKYKGSRIEWDVDECAQPLETAPRPAENRIAARIRSVPLKTKKPTVKMQNRFATLRLDDDDNENDDDETDAGFDTSTEYGMG